MICPNQPDPQNLWIVSYDIPMKPTSPRLKFYRRLAKLRKAAKSSIMFESASVVVSDDEALITEVFRLAQEYGASRGGMHRISGMFEEVARIVEAAQA